MSRAFDLGGTGIGGAVGGGGPGPGGGPYRPAPAAPAPAAATPGLAAMRADFGDADGEYFVDDEDADGPRGGGGEGGRGAAPPQSHLVAQAGRIGLSPSSPNPRAGFDFAAGGGGGVAAGLADGGGGGGMGSAARAALLPFLMHGPSPLDRLVHPQGGKLEGVDAGLAPGAAPGAAGAAGGIVGGAPGGRVGGGGGGGAGVSGLGLGLAPVLVPEGVGALPMGMGSGAPGAASTPLLVAASGLFLPAQGGKVGGLPRITIHVSQPVRRGWGGDRGGVCVGSALCVSSSSRVRSPLHFLWKPAPPPPLSIHVCAHKRVRWPPPPPPPPSFAPPPPPARARWRAVTWSRT
jgi:hypothetical protein